MDSTAILTLKYIVQLFYYFFLNFFSVFMMGDENMRRKNAPGYLQIILLVYAAKWPRLDKKGLNVFLEK